MNSRATEVCVPGAASGRLFSMWLFAPFRIDAANQTLYRENVRVAIMPKPFAVLCYLVDHHGRLVAQDELLKAIWPETHVQPEVLRRYILEIRRALGDDPDFENRSEEHTYELQSRGHIVCR